MAQFYEEVPAPRLVRAALVPLEAELLTQALSERTGAKVRIDVPQRGDRMKLIRQAQRNAVEALDRRLAETTTQGKILRDMADLFGLDGPPDRIEIYDNSHIQGTNALGAMVVAGPEGLRKKPHPPFNIKPADTWPGSEFAVKRQLL